MTNTPQPSFDQVVQAFTAPDAGGRSQAELREIYDWLRESPEPSRHLFDDLIGRHNEAARQHQGGFTAGCCCCGLDPDDIEGALERNDIEKHEREALTAATAEESIPDQAQSAAPVIAQYRTEVKAIEPEQRKAAASQALAFRLYNRQIGRAHV